MDAAQALGVTFGPVEVADFPTACGSSIMAVRGLAVSRDVSVGEILLTIPNSVCFNARKAQSRLPDWAEDLSEEAQIGLWLATCAKSDLSMAAYVDSLPRAFASVLYWSPETLELLQGTSFHEMARGFREETEIEWAFLIDSGGLAADWTREHGLTEESFRWGKSAAASRQANIFGEGEPPILVPGFDLLNHSNMPTASVADSQNSIVVRATSHMGVGDQVFISYGPLSNAGLLTFYGFALPLPNKYDCVELILRLPVTPARVDAVKALNEISDDPASFQMISTGEDDGEIVTRHCLYVSNPLPHELLAFFKLQVGEGALSAAQQQAAHASLRTMFLQLLQDRAGITEATQVESDHGGLRALIAQVRIEEGRILSAALAALDALPEEAG